MNARWASAIGLTWALTACSTPSSETLSDGERATTAEPSIAAPSTLTPPSVSLAPTTAPPTVTIRETPPEPPTITTLAPAPQEPLLPRLQGVRWVALERDGQRWPFAYVAYVEFGSSAIGGAINPLFGGNDGCNWYGVNGSLDGDRLALDESQSTAMGCGPGTGGAIPHDGDRLQLSEDGSTLDVIDPNERPRLSFVRADRLSAVSPAELIGSWNLAPDDPGILIIDASGVITFGTCQWSWSLDEKLTVSGFPSDPYTCLGIRVSHTASRLVEMFVNGPVDARTATSGDLYLIDDQFVIRLTHQQGDDAPPVVTSSGGFCREVPVDVPTRCPIDTHCGVGMFSSRVNGRWWVTEEGRDVLDYIPPAWGTYTDPPESVTVVVTGGPDPTLTATLNGHSVVYHPIPDDEFVGCG